VSLPGWSDAVTAALVFAVDPIGTGVLLRARAGPVRDRWLGILRAALPAHDAFKTSPSHIADGRLLGGLDLDATLRSGRPVAERGLLGEADGGVLLLAMAERLPSSTTAHLTAAMDNGETRVERDGVSAVTAARFGVVALDEGLEDEAAPAALRDRLALHLDLEAIGWRETDDLNVDKTEIAEARAQLASIEAGHDQIDALCNVAAALGIASLRAPLQALRVARAAAALSGRSAVAQDDIALAARLVFAPRATVFPPSQQDQPPEQPPPPEDSTDAESDQDEQTPDLDRALDEVILAAAQAAIPADLLASLRAGAIRARGRGAGKSGAMQKSKSRGRPTGTRRGELRGGGKLNLIETLRAAAPWQRLRRAAVGNAAATRVIVRPDDFRITRFRQRSETATIFVVDASGSAALHRLAEAKGAVELLLADCYVRRDQVALIAFRGAVAEILLPPTRSLTRAKRSLAGLPGGGGTPLAAGLDAAFVLADSIKRKGQTPSVVILTDGRANIARDGAPGRSRAEQDATSAARTLRESGIATVLVDTSPRPGPSGAQLAQDMGARYLPLPYADAVALSQAVKAVVG
jgi:magnesium chelatase subunit D